MRTDLILWLALVQSTLIYPVVTVFLGLPAPGTEPADVVIVAALGGLGLLCALAGAAVSLVFARTAQMRIVGWALGEACGLFGLVLAFLAAPMAVAYALMGLGTVTVIAGFPATPPADA